jgi:hypothetical protein
VPLFDMSHAGEAISYLLGFWLFIFSRTFRKQRMEQWQAAALGGKIVWLIESAFATVLGFSPLIPAWYLLLA